MQDGLTVEVDVYFDIGRQSQKTLQTGKQPEVPRNRIPRVAK